ncbi:MAG: sulfur carrier protein ThiS [Pseudomonadota bacterium]
MNLAGNLTMMTLLVNGDSREVPAGITLSDLVALLGLENRRLAAEINENLVPRSGYTTCRLEPGDRIEIIHAVGGG